MSFFKCNWTSQKNAFNNLQWGVCGRVIPLQFLDCVKKVISFPSKVTRVCTSVPVCV